MTAFGPATLSEGTEEFCLGGTRTAECRYGIRLAGLRSILYSIDCLERPNYSLCTLTDGFFPQSSLACPTIPIVPPLACGRQEVSDGLTSRSYKMQIGRNMNRSMAASRK